MDKGSDELPMRQAIGWGGGRGKGEGPAAVMGAAMGETHLTERARRRRLVLGIGIALLGGLRPAGDGILVCRPGSLLLRRLSAIDVRQSIFPSSQSATTTGSQCQARREEGTNDGRRLQRWEGAPDKEGGQVVGGRGFVAGEAQQGLKFRGGSTEGVVSHLAVGAAAAAAAAAALGSPSLLLYVGRGVMDLMSVAEEEDGEGEAGLEVDDRPSMLPEHWLPVECCWWHVWKLWGNGPVRAGEMVWECGSGREGVCSDWANQSRSWGDWIEQSQIARHGLGVEGEGREQQRRALERSHSGALGNSSLRGLGHWGTGRRTLCSRRGWCRKQTQAETQNPKVSPQAVQRGKTRK